MFQKSSNYRITSWMPVYLSIQFMIVLEISSYQTEGNNNDILHGGFFLLSFLDFKFIF